MTQEKQILLIDLCGRLPYCVKCYYEKDGGKAPIHTVTIGLFAEVANREDVICKPYLRPMSSMTEEEEKEYYGTMDKETQRNYPNSCDFSESVYYSMTIKTFDWLNEHHFDYRGLIKKGLALEAPEGMYKEEQV